MISRFSTEWKLSPLVNGGKKSCFDDIDYMYSMSVAETVVTIIVCDVFQFGVTDGLRFNDFKLKDMRIIFKNKINQCPHAVLNQNSIFR